MKFNKQVLCILLGQFLTDIGRHQEAVVSYLSAAHLAPTDFELVFNTASALRFIELRCIYLNKFYV